MLLMVSVQNLPEALQALKGGADIVDVKNLQEALVGSAHPTVVKQVRDAVPGSEHASVTLGVVPNQSGTVAMAAYTAGVLDATSVKVGFMKSQYDEAVEILLDAKKALEAFNTKLIGSLFADNLLYDGLDARYMNPAREGWPVRRLADRHIDEGWPQPVRLCAGARTEGYGHGRQGSRHEHGPVRAPQAGRPGRIGQGQS